jgi:hypothetical protein
MRNTETYGLTGVNWNDGNGFKDSLRDLRIDAKFQRSATNNDEMELLFDATEEQIEKIESNFKMGENIEKIDVLP